MRGCLSTSLVINVCRMEMKMKKLPDSELELMMIIWHAGKAVTRQEIESQLSQDRRLGPTTILTFLSRLQEKGFVKIIKNGKSNLYEPIIAEEDYLKQESRNILKRMYRNSVKNFMAALYDGDQMSTKDIEELQVFLDEKKRSVDWNEW